jgi:hypothetical protein
MATTWHTNINMPSSKPNTPQPLTLSYTRCMQTVSPMSPPPTASMALSSASERPTDGFRFGSNMYEFNGMSSGEDRGRHAERMTRYAAQPICVNRHSPVSPLAFTFASPATMIPEAVCMNAHGTTSPTTLTNHHTLLPATIPTTTTFTTSSATTTLDTVDLSHFPLLDRTRLDSFAPVSCSSSTQPRISDTCVSNADLASTTASILPQVSTGFCRSDARYTPQVNSINTPATSVSPTTSHSRTDSLLSIQQHPPLCRRPTTVHHSHQTTTTTTTVNYHLSQSGAPHPQATTAPSSVEPIYSVSTSNTASCVSKKMSEPNRLGKCGLGEGGKMHGCCVVMSR